MQPQLNGKASTMEMMPPQQSTASEATGILPSQTARIEVIGVGGGGSNAVNRMIQSDLEGVAYSVLNTDAQALLQSASTNRVQLGQTLTAVLGQEEITSARRRRRNPGRPAAGSAGDRSRLHRSWHGRWHRYRCCSRGG